MNESMNVICRILLVRNVLRICAFLVCFQYRPGVEQYSHDPIDINIIRI